jgi:OmpA-OmpF porin, OOP family
MANSMFESILGMVTPEMTQSIASRLGESSSGVQQGLSAATAATLSGLARSSGESGFIDKLMQMVSRAASQNITGNLGSMISAGPSGPAGELGKGLSSLVFGSQQGQIANLISQQGGLSSNAGSGILKMAGALVLGHLARMSSAGSLSPSTLAGTLRTEASGLSNYVPGSFLAKLGGTASEAVDREETIEREGVVRGAPSYASNVLHAEGPRIADSANRWVAPALAALVGAAVLGWVIHRLVNPVSAVNVTARTAENAAVGVASLGEPVSVTLPNGTQLNVPSNGVEAHLVGFLQHPAGQPSVIWFNFDRLLFDTDQATLQPQSNEQLDNIAAIMKAYPSVNFQMGGYTDNTGDPNANRALSEQRAQNVMAALVQRGVDPGRLSARGYGSDNPVADNSTAAGRQLNRRISIRVASK